MTAIIMAGRTGAAYAAQISETDAPRTVALSISAAAAQPLQLLPLPCVIAQAPTRRSVLDGLVGMLSAVKPRI